MTELVRVTTFGDSDSNGAGNEPQEALITIPCHAGISEEFIPVSTDMQPRTFARLLVSIVRHNPDLFLVDLENVDWNHVGRPFRQVKLYLNGDEVSLYELSEVFHVPPPPEDNEFQLYLIRNAMKLGLCNS